jgi:enamine deaminase RidA (YjgF/YER057c/UK114 family)
MAASGAGDRPAAAALGIDPLESVHVIGVAALAEPDLLIEIDAIAVLP